MQTLKRGFAVAALLFSPLTMAQDINAQLTTWFSPASGWLQRRGGCHAPFTAQSAAELRAASLQHDGQREAVGQRQCGGALRQ